MVAAIPDCATRFTPMPIYEYACDECSHRLEVLQRISDEALQECPACGRSSLRRLISAAGFVLKGTGWYATDFKGGSKSKRSDQGAATGEGGGSGTQKSGDAAAAPAAASAAAD
jgi:putative FmdB family regulatory protein